MSLDQYFILIETALFDAGMRSQLQGQNPRNGFYGIDSDDTRVEVELLSDGSPFKRYYVMTWARRGSKPTSVLARYKTTAEGGSNYKVNWIMTREEYRLNVEPDIKPFNTI